MGRESQVSEDAPRQCRYDQDRAGTECREVLQPVVVELRKLYAGVVELLLSLVPVLVQLAHLTRSRRTDATRSDALHAPESPPDP
jgi:hypothetical protein